MNTKNILIGLSILIICAGLVTWGILDSKAQRQDAPKTEEVSPDKKAQLDEFAQCIADSGTTFYGTFWCPYCQSQKADFRNSTNLPYVECSKPNKQMNATCVAAGIKNFPTWEFPDGSRQTGRLPLQMLAEKTDCALPADEAKEVTAGVTGESAPSSPAQ